MSTGNSKNAGLSLSSSHTERRSQMDLQDRGCERQRVLLSRRGRMKLHAGAYSVLAQSSPTAQSKVQSISSSVSSGQRV